MNPFAPTSEGFRLISRQPAIPLAEIAWRWSLVAATWFLSFFLILNYLDGLPVSALDRLLLASGDPLLVSRAIARIFRGSLYNLTEAAVLVGLALTLAWILLASCGRAATVNALYDEFGIDRQGSRRAASVSLIALNVARSAITLAAFIGTLGALLIAGSFRISTHLAIADASRLLVVLLFLVWLAWWGLNWLLSTAALVLLGQGGDALAAIVSTLRLCQDKAGPVFATTAIFVLFHIGALATAWFLGVLIFGMLGALQPGQIVVLELAVVGLYFLVTNVLYAARMAAYVFISRPEEKQDLRGRAGGWPVDNSGQAPIDRGEVILSDVPLIAQG
ncbi:MAG: hypothetical protein JO159_09270 [Acidobacteria bacterium]|nr:hypothetical protein [Acidobacteriota bacterium]MBV9625506.1 hypothetical protein [Acidobacteriota bacterium]